MSIPVRIVSKNEERIVIRNDVGACLTIPLSYCETFAHKLLMVDKIEDGSLNFSDQQHCMAGEAAKSLHTKVEGLVSDRYVAKERVKEITVGTLLKLVSPINLGLPRGLYDEGEIVKVIREYGTSGWVIEGETYLLNLDLLNANYIRVLRPGEF